MHFPKFWARGVWRGTDRAGRPVERDAWGWSDASPEAARAHGEQLARRRAESFDPHHPPTRRYAYPNRPLREPVVRTIPGEVHAVVSRNRLGCEVLNTDNAVFVDVDLPPAIPARGLLQSLFGRRRPAGDDARVAAEADQIAKLDAWQRRNPGSSFRVYRTAAGLRYLLTSSLHGTAEPLVADLFVATGADEAYRLLCHQQKSFRARLTPKPWRCGVEQPVHRHPVEGTVEKAQMDQWCAAYEEAARRWATCLFLVTLGSGVVAPVLQPLLAAHDAATKAESNLPLA